jgi:Contractile injection system tube protein/LysM domain
MLVKAFFTRKDNLLELVPCLFNPTELSVEKSNHYAETNIPGLSAPVYQFVRGNVRSISLELFFDTYELGIDVRLFTDRITGWDAGSMFSSLPGGLRGLMDIDSELHAPPICLFIWGTYIFQCIIDSVSKKFTMFNSLGFPLRATLNVTLKEYREVDVQVKELDKHSSDLTKSRTVHQGDSLWAIAASEYGDPKDWRLIADANGIANPRKLETGQKLVIPVKE